MTTKLFFDSINTIKTDSGFNEVDKTILITDVIENTIKKLTDKGESKYFINAITENQSIITNFIRLYEITREQMLD